MAYVAGVGWRYTPNNILTIMSYCARIIHAEGKILRSGGAIGPDEVMAGEFPSDRKEIFTVDSDIPEWAFDSVDFFHPNPSACKGKVRRLMARNAMILLGENRDEPVDYVVCYTLNGKTVGGTGQSIRIADHYDIPLFNLGDKETLRNILTYLLEHTLILDRERAFILTEFNHVFE